MTQFEVLNQWPVSEWEWPKVTVFVPMMPALPFADEVFPAFIEIARHGTPFMHIPYGYAERVANLAAWTFLESKFTHMLILDSDHPHPPDIVHQLAYHVIKDPEKLVVGGLNFRRTSPYDPLCLVDIDGKNYRPQEWEPGLMEVVSIGSASLLISREVFEKIEPPWFLNEYNEEIMTTGGYDEYFCHKLREAGIKIWCDMGLTSPHMGTHRVTKQTFDTYNQAYPAPEAEVITIE